jgi:hypothetical protein
MEEHVPPKRRVAFNFTTGVTYRKITRALRNSFLLLGSLFLSAIDVSVSFGSRRAEKIAACFMLTSCAVKI